MIPLCLLWLVSAAYAIEPTDARARSWSGEVRVHGVLRELMHGGQEGPTLALGGMVPNPDLYAVGALADLAGEVTVAGGKVYLSYPDGTDARTETPSKPNAAAALLVAAEVPAWRTVTTDRRIGFDELDAEVGRLAAAAGMNLAQRFPFVLEGEFEDLEWHVIDGRRLPAGGSHQDHRSTAVRTKLKRASALLVGFFSQNDQGVFTHMGSKTHIHCVREEPLATGHLDHVTIPAGTTLKFPDVKR